jgi:hypothetical protein
MELAALKGEPVASEGLAAGLTFSQAAEAAGVSRRTVAARMADGEYRRRVMQLRSELLARAAGVLASDAPAAAELLRTLRDTAEMDPTTRRLCAVAVLDFAAKLCGAVELADRLADLEADLEGVKRDLETAAHRDAQKPGPARTPHGSGGNGARGAQRGGRADVARV